jgi:hypothetical protein
MEWERGNWSGFEEEGLELEGLKYTIVGYT